MHQILFWKFLSHIGAFLDHLAGVETPTGRVPVPKTGLNWANISASMRVQCTKYFWRFLRHIETYLDHLTGVETPAGRVLGPKIGLSWGNTWRKRRSISQLLLGPHAPNTFLEVPDTHRNISRLPGRCWNTYRQSASAQNWPKLSKYISFYEGPMHQILFGGSWDI